MKNLNSEYNLLNYQNDIEKQDTSTRKSNHDKNMYEKYIDRTSGLDEGFTRLVFGQSTNSTKSKFDNIVGWIKLGK